MAVLPKWMLTASTQNRCSCRCRCICLLWKNIYSSPEIISRKQGRLLNVYMFTCICLSISMYRYIKNGMSGISIPELIWFELKVFTADVIHRHDSDGRNVISYGLWAWVGQSKAHMNARNIPVNPKEAKYDIDDFICFEDNWQNITMLCSGCLIHNILGFSFNLLKQLSHKGIKISHI